MPDAPLLRGPRRRPDRIFGAVSPGAGRAPRRAPGTAAGRGRRARGPEVLHLHHLTPIHEAAARELPAAAAGHPPARHRAEDDRPRRAPWPSGRAAWTATRPESWDATPTTGSQRLRTLGRRASDRFDRDLARTTATRRQRLLGVERDASTWIPNGVDLDRFDRADPTPQERARPLARVARRASPRAGPRAASRAAWPTPRSSWRRSPTRPPASRPRCCCSSAASPRSSAIPLLVRAYARATGRFERPAPLVIWGGFPGEWEGEHPHTVRGARGHRGRVLRGLARALASWAPGWPAPT